MTNELLTVDDLCRRFRITRWTLRKWEKNGRIPPRAPLPGHPRWRARDIDAFISGQPAGRVFFGSHRSQSVAIRQG